MLINAGYFKMFHCSTEYLSRFSTCFFSFLLKLFWGRYFYLCNYFMQVSMLLLEYWFRLLYSPLNLKKNSVSVSFDAASVAVATDSSICLLLSHPVHFLKTQHSLFFVILYFFPLVWIVDGKD